MSQSKNQHLHRGRSTTETQAQRIQQHSGILTVQHVLNEYMKQREHLQPYQVAFVWSNLRKAVQQEESSRSSSSTSNNKSKQWNDAANNNNNNNTYFWTNHEMQTLLVHSMQLVVHGWNGRSIATVTHSLAKLLDLTTTSDNGGGGYGDGYGGGGGTLAAVQQQQQQQQQLVDCSKVLESLWDALLLRSTTLLETSSLSSKSSRDNNFKAVEVSNLWWAYAKVVARSQQTMMVVPRLPPPPERLLNALASTALACLDEFGPQGLSNVTWAIATLNTHHHQAAPAAALLPPPLSSLLNAIAQTAQLQVNHFKAQELSNLIWAFATLNHNNAPSLSLLDAVANSRVIHTRIIDDFTPQALANTAWAFATFHHDHHHHYDKSPTLPLLFNTLAKAAQARIGQFKAQEISSIAWAFATVQHKQTPPELFCAIARAAQVRIDDFNPQALANTAWAFATLNHRDHHEARPSPLLGAIAKRARLQIQHFSPQALSNMAWAFATLNHAEPALFQAIAQAARLRMCDFNPQELVNITWAFATFNYKVPLLLRDIAATAAANASWSNFTIQGMATMAWSFAVFDNVDSNNDNNNNSSFMTDPNSSYAQTLLSIVNDDDSSNSALTVEELCQFYQFDLWCKEQNATAEDDWFPKDLSRRCKEAFVSIEVPAEPSVLQKDVVMTLATLPDVSHVEVEVLTEIGYRLDAVVTIRGSNLLIGVEVDGPSHFVGQSQSPNGKTVLKQRQLRAFLEGWKLVSVPYWEWNKILQFSDGHASMKLEKQRYLQDLLNQAVH